MSARKAAVSADYSWEKKNAPAVSNTYWMLVRVLFVLWVFFLVAMSVYRWVLTLQ